LENNQEVNDIIIEGKDSQYITYNHRIIGDDNFYLLANFAPYQVNASIEFNLKGKIEILDPETGNEYKSEEFKINTSENLSINLDFPGTRSLIFKITPQNENLYLIKPQESSQVKKVIILMH